jgi:hypothetical protein
MTTEERLEKQASRIADAIVDLVEHTDGPVTLAQIERKVSGFAEKSAPSWEYTMEHDDGEMLIWDGMTEAGLEALIQVMSGRRVAVQHVSGLPYVLEPRPRSENWLPIVLLPVRAANLDTPRWRMRCSQRLRDACVTTATEEGKSGYRSLTPGAVRCTADQFSP